jgi:hypothetical protein
MSAPLGVSSNARCKCIDIFSATMEHRPEFPGRAGGQVTWVRALWHATTLIPIKIDN